MNLKEKLELQLFLSAYIFDREPEADKEAVRAFIGATTDDEPMNLISQIQEILTVDGLSLEELGTESNRWFGNLIEARDWFREILGYLEEEKVGRGTSVKDSNGTPLSEGDSVLVIKDLKVKGGSSDLKRGTVVKKIHLVDDPEVVECRVDGSTLVLKTCFLRKA